MASPESIVAQHRLRRDVDTKDEEIARLRKDLDAVRGEANRQRAECARHLADRSLTAALLTRMAGALGLHACLARDESAEPGWKHVVYVELPAGQVSWRVRDEELSLFSHMMVEPCEWDGHTRDERDGRMREPGNLTADRSADDGFAFVPEGTQSAFLLEKMREAMERGDVRLPPAYLLGPSPFSLPAIVHEELPAMVAEARRVGAAMARDGFVMSGDVHVGVDLGSAPDETALVFMKDGKVVHETVRPNSGVFADVESLREDGLGGRLR